MGVGITLSLVNDNDFVLKEKLLKDEQGRVASLSFLLFFTDTALRIRHREIWIIDLLGGQPHGQDAHFLLIVICIDTTHRVVD